MDHTDTLLFFQKEICDIVEKNEKKYVTDELINKLQTEISDLYSTYKKRGDNLGNIKVVIRRQEKDKNKVEVLIMDAKEANQMLESFEGTIN